MTLRPAHHRPARFAAAAALGLLAACADAPGRYAVPAAPVTDARIQIAYRTVAVREVSLPDYAASEEIYMRRAGGALMATDALWADDPARAMTEEVALYLEEMTGAQVAGEPWPFLDRPQAEVEIRVTEMLADEGGEFRLAGQYFVVPDEGDRDRSGRFTLSAPLPPEAPPGSIATARGMAVRDLARTIAREGLR